MDKIIHLSDLHFGTEKVPLIEILLQEINLIRPDIVIVSGDLTQRATHQQYQAASNFLKNIHFPLLCVPGNHDIALYNIIERFFYPFHKYHSWITSPIYSQFVHKQMAILGINSVTPFKPMSGYVSDEQLLLVKRFFQSHQDYKIKIIVMHHNLVRSERHKIINDADKLIDVFAECGVNLVLSGHLHIARIELLKTKLDRHPMYVLTAGTPISTRTIEPNSFNLLQFHDKNFELIIKTFVNNEFVTTKEDFFIL